MIGQTISHYKIVNKLGAGGMGEVFLAEDTDLNRRVALKFLPESLQADDEARERLLREAQAASRLNHPNVLTIHAIERVDDRAFIVMEHVDGQSLKKLIGDDGIGFDEFISLAMQICDGMAAAHEAGLVHRDIKPDNIMVTSKGQVKIMDFGLATWRGARQLTKDGSTVGTMAYMSPEQAQNKDVDQRSDLFSLGAVLYEMLTGRTPFTGDHEAAIIYSIVNEEPEPLARYKSNLPEAMQGIIGKALDKDPETRYQSAAGLNADLRREKKFSDSGSGVRPYASGSVPAVPKRRSIFRILIPSTAFAVVAFIFLITKPWKLEVQPTQDASAQENRLAIMYFENLADPTDAKRLGKIVTNLLITDLSESHYFQVVSNQRLYDILKRLGIQGANSVDQETASGIAVEAGAKWMLLGSILQADPNFVLTSQLVEVESGNVIASQQITGTEGETIFPLVDRLTREIRNDLALPAEASEEKDLVIADVTSHSTEAYGYYLDGLDYASKLYMQEARESFRRAVALDSTFAMAYCRLAFITQGTEARRKLIDKAVQYSDRVTNKERLLILACEAEVNENNKESARYLEELISEYPDEKQAYLFLAYIYRQEKDHAKTIQYLTSLIGIDPLYKDAYNLLAYEYDAIGEIEKSISAINKYLEIAPDEANPYDTRGDLYAYNGEPELALQSYLEALRLKPDFSHSQRKAAILQTYLQDYSDAARNYQDLAGSPLSGSRNVGRSGLVTIQSYQGKFNEALRVLNQAIAAEELEGSSQTLPSKYFMKAVILVHQEKFQDALAAGEAALNACDTTNHLQLARGQLLRAFVLSHSGQISEASSAIQAIEAMRASPDSSDVEYVLNLARGWVALHRGQYDDAISALGLCVQHDKDFSAAYGMARAYLESGQLGEAVDVLERALKRYDDGRMFSTGFNVLAHYWLGVAYEQSGWAQKAIAQYEEFLDIWKDADPGIAEIEDARTRLTKLKTQS